MRKQIQLTQIRALIQTNGGKGEPKIVDAEIVTDITTRNSERKVTYQTMSVIPQDKYSEGRGTCITPAIVIET